MSRPLSPIEHAIYMVDTVVSQSFVIIARVSGNLSEPVLRKSLDMVQEKHPPLRWKIIDHQGPKFSADGVPGIPLRIIDREKDEQWIEEAEEEMQKPFSWSEGPLVRVVQLKGQNQCDLLITFCHIHTDGTSGVSVLGDVLRFADQLARGETMAQVKSLEAPLSSIELLREDLEFQKESPDAVAESAQNIPAAEFKGGREVLPEERITRIIHKVLEPSDAENLVRRSKAERTSVHGTLCGAFLQALVEVSREMMGVEKKGPLRIGCITPVNIRNHFHRPPGEDIGYYISFAVHHQDVDDKVSLWDTARAVKESIENEVKTGRDIEAIRGVGEALKEFSKPIDLVRAINTSNPSVAATNLGKLDIPEKFGDFLLENLHVSVSISPDTKDGFAIAVTTHRGRMTINFLFAEPYITRIMAVRIADDTVKRLKDAC